MEARKAGAERSPWIGVAGVVAVFAAGALGSLFTAPSIQDGWYGSLVKPPLQPPSFLFGIVWPILYVLISVAFVLASRANDHLKSVVFPFAIQVVLNGLWSIVFFGARSPVGGLFVILGLLTSIVFMMRAFHKAAPVSAGLLTPYLLWVCFATYLNAGIVVLNR
ncbi:MAG: tryptophan-rich sensory protein [Fimbriimonadaceae bacterium]|nr:tryptophan-rich sensory protein [Fimbriimonadaceae bacterium]